jgi:tetratricopeptide (TPR) repeat protein
MNWWSRLLGRGEQADSGTTVQSIVFDTDGWTSVKTHRHAREWRDDLGNTLRVCLHRGPAEYLGESQDMRAIRAFCRRKAGATGRAIVSVERLNVAGIQCLEVIDKGERRPGYAYDGAIAIPLADCHFTIVMNAFEHGTTGVREAAVTCHLLQTGDLDVSALDPSVLREGESAGLPIPGWFWDPYDPDYSGHVLYSLSDDVRFDELFPDHPLSRIRQTLAAIRRSVTFDASVPLTETRCAIDDAEGEAPAASRISVQAVASLYLQAGRFDEVVEVVTTSLRGIDTGSAPDHIAIARQSVLLGFAQESQGRLEAAEAAHRKASASFAIALGEDDQETAQALSNVARTLIAQGKHEEAESLFLRALRVFDAAEESDSSVAVALNGLGLVYNARQLYSEAIPCFERALAIIERVHGPTFPDVATVLRNMAFSWQELGMTDRMVEALQRAERVAGSHTSS